MKEKHLKFDSSFIVFYLIIASIAFLTGLIPLILILHNGLKYAIFSNCYLVWFVSIPLIIVSIPLYLGSLKVRIKEKSKRNLLKISIYLEITPVIIVILLTIIRLFV